MFQVDGREGVAAAAASEAGLSVEEDHAAESVEDSAQSQRRDIETRRAQRRARAAAVLDFLPPAGPGR